MQLPLQVSSGLYTLIQMFLCCRWRIYPLIPFTGDLFGLLEVVLQVFIMLPPRSSLFFCSCWSCLFPAVLFSSLHVVVSPSPDVFGLLTKDHVTFITQTLRWHDCVECWGMMLHEIWVLVSVCCSLHSMIYNLYPFLWCLKVFIKIGEVFSAAVRLSEELWSVNFPCIQWEPRTHEISLFFSCRNCMNQHNKTFEISTVHKNKLCTRWG